MCVRTKSSSGLALPESRGAIVSAAASDPQSMSMRAGFAALPYSIHRQSPLRAGSNSMLKTRADALLLPERRGDCADDPRYGLTGGVTAPLVATGATARFPPPSPPGA